MPDKILQKIQAQINELTPSLELFLDDTIQPSVDDCEDFKKQLNAIYDNLIIYKYHKQTKELSPSFNLHAKLSEKVVSEEKKPEPVKEEPKIKEQAEPKPPSPEVRKAEPLKLKPLLIGINDKFRFMNELFSQNASEYNIVLEQLNNLNTWHETEIYLNSLKTVYSWKENSEVVKYFYSIIKARFN